MRPSNFHRRLIPCGRRQSIFVLMGAVLMFFDLKLTRSIDLRQARSKQAESSSHLTGKSSPKPSASGGNGNGNGNGKSGNAHSSSKNNQQSSKGKPQAASNSRNNKKNKSGQRLNQHDLIVTIDLVIQLSIHSLRYIWLFYLCRLHFLSPILPDLGLL